MQPSRRILISTVRSILTGVLLLAPLPRMIPAQAIDIGPSLGFYQPPRGFDPASILSSDLPEKPSELRGLAWGAEARVSLRKRLSIEGAFATIPSKTRGFVSPGNAAFLQSRERVNVFTLEGQYN